MKTGNRNSSTLYRLALPMIIKLVRHGESKANARELDPQQVGDHTIPLSPLGRQQALQAGGAIGHAFLRGALLYTSRRV